MSVVDREDKRGSDQRTSIEQQTIELLKSEIEALQTALSENDLRFAAFSRGGSTECRVEPQPDPRLDRLASELKESDGRIANLEDALHASEEAIAANDAERCELLKWVDEIENRVAEQEDEWRAEKEVLNRRIGEADCQYNMLMQRFEAVGQVGRSAALTESLQVLRSENDAFREKLSLKQHELEELRKCLDEAEKFNREEQIQRRVADQVREERLQLAQERAVFSRQKLELTKRLQLLQQELEMRERKQHPADQKFRAFRDRLKELHEQEQAEFLPPTLTQKLKRLWDRLDGPTDRD